VTLEVSVGIGLGNEAWDDAVTWVGEAERLGVHSAWTSETWGFDAATPLAYLAAKTSSIKLGAGIMQLGARSPATVAMTALSLASMSGDRFLLGLGASGPQVIEGWHGVPFDRPYTRLRETVEVIRLATAGERLAYDGDLIKLPLPGGEGRALRPAAPPRHIPIYLATLGPRSLRLTGELADGWIASSFFPDHADVFLPHIREGAARAGRSFESIDRRAGGVVHFGDDLDALVQPRKPGFAFEIGAMGSPEHNFYRDAYARQGYPDLVERVLALWLERKRDAAAALIPDDFVIRSNFLGTDDQVRDRIRVYRDHGITNLAAAPAGDTLPERLDTLERFMHLVAAVNAEPAPTAARSPR
jgi:F420-dependent oxidoreductase-like protein